MNIALFFGFVDYYCCWFPERYFKKEQVKNKKDDMRIKRKNEHSLSLGVSVEEDVFFETSYFVAAVINLRLKRTWKPPNPTPIKKDLAEERVMKKIAFWLSPSHSALLNQKVVSSSFRALSLSKEGSKRYK